MIFLSKHISLYALDRLKWILDIIWPLNQHFMLKKPKKFAKISLNVKILECDNCIFVHCTKKLTFVIMHPLGQDTTYFIIHCTLIVPGRERKALSSHKVAFATRYATMAGIIEFSPRFFLSFLHTKCLLSGVYTDYRPIGSSKVKHWNYVMIFEVIYWAICVLIFRVICGAIFCGELSDNFLTTFWALLKAVLT